MSNKNNSIFVVLAIFALAFLYTYIPSKWDIREVVREEILNHEYSKIGGKEAYEIKTELEKVINTHPDNPNNLEAQKSMLSQLKDGGTVDSTTGDGTTTLTDSSNKKAVSTITEDMAKEIMKDAVVEGNKDADIVMVEYSDLECPYCLIQHNENKIKSRLLEEYKDNIAVIFKNNRGVDHSGTEAKALALICAQTVGDDEKYKAFYNKIFEYSEKNTGKYFPVSDLPELAKEIGLDEEKYNKCIKAPETLSRFEKETAEAQSFSLGGTPGTLIFNKKTGEYKTIAGAYPYTEFKKAVDSLK